MRVKTEHGFTECSFAKFAEVEPKVIKIRQLFREKKIDGDKVRELVAHFFGPTRQFSEWQPGWGLKEWDAHVESLPLSHRLLYYNPEVVAGCVMGEDE